MDRTDSTTFAYREVRELELLLRRTVRWELMTAYGRHWLNALDDLADAIQEREKKERMADLYDGNSSELSYLSLGELLNLVFRRKWQEIFRKIFTGDRSLERELFREIVPLRNKVAHFRTTTAADLVKLRVLSEVRKALAAYYGHSTLVQAYLSSDPDLASEQIEEEAIFLSNALANSGHSQVWNTYGEIECLRARGFDVGIGLYSSSVFVELRSPTELAITRISDWSQRERFIVCFTTIEERTIRVFWPLTLTAPEIRRSMLSLQKLMLSKTSPVAQLKNESSVGEIVIPRAGNSSVGLAF